MCDLLLLSSDMGSGFWRLHVTGSEIRCQLPRLPRNHNRQGKFIGDSDKGPLHLQPVHQVYPTKESLQPKRYPGPSHWHHLRLRLPWSIFQGTSQCLGSSSEDGSVVGSAKYPFGVSGARVGQARPAEVDQAIIPVAWLHGLYTSNARIPQWSKTKSHRRCQWYHLQNRVIWTIRRFLLLSSHAVCVYLQTPALVLDSQRKLFHSSLLLGSTSRIQRRVSTISICHRKIIWNCKMAKGIWHRPDGLKAMWVGVATQDYGCHRSLPWPWSGMLGLIAGDSRDLQGLWRYFHYHFSHCTICWYRSLSCSSREVSSLSGRTTNYPDSSVAPWNRHELQLHSSRCILVQPRPQPSALVFVWSVGGQWQFPILLLLFWECVRLKRSSESDTIRFSLYYINNSRLFTVQ